MRIGLALHCEVRPSIFHRKNYFYPGHAQGLSDQPVRRAHQRERVARAARRQPGADRARPHGGGHRQDLAHRRGRSHPRRRLFPRRLQPGRACPWWRSSPRPTSGPPTQARLYASELRGILVATGRVGRAHGGRVHARRRQRVGAPAGHLRARHALRDQEPELAALARAGHRVRDRAADRPARGGRQGPPADAALERGRRGSPWPCARRRRPSTTATSPSPISCRSYPTPAGSQRWPPSIGPMPAERRDKIAALFGPESGHRRPRRSDRHRGRARPRRPGRGPPPTPAWTPRWRWHAPPTRPPPIPRGRARLDVARSRRCCAWSRTASSAPPRPRRCWPTCSKTGAIPPTSPGAGASRPWRRTRCRSSVVSRGGRRAPRRVGRYCGGEDKLAGFFTGHVMRATDNRANGKAVAAELRRLRG